MKNLIITLIVVLAFAACNEPEIAPVDDSTLGLYSDSGHQQSTKVIPATDVFVNEENRDDTEPGKENDQLLEDGGGSKSSATEVKRDTAYANDVF